mgnify:CR=1 FL=1
MRSCGDLTRWSQHRSALRMLGLCINGAFYRPQGSDVAWGFGSGSLLHDSRGTCLVYGCMWQLQPTTGLLPQAACFQMLSLYRNVTTRPA